MRTTRPLVGVAILFFLNGLTLGSWLPRLPELRDTLGLSLGGLGLALGVSGLGGLIGSAISGWVVGRFGARRSAVHPAAVVIILLPALAVGSSAIVFAAVLSLIAVADAVADVGMNAFAARVEQARGGSIFSRLHGLWSVGSLTGAAVSTISIALGVSLRQQLLVTAVLGIGAVLTAGRLLPEVEPRPRPRPHRRVAAALAVGGAAVAALEGIPSDWGAIFMIDVLGADAATAGTAFLAVSAGMLAGRLAGDLVVDRVGVTPALLGSLALVAAGIAGSVLSTRVALTLGAMAVWGLGVSVTLPLLYQMAGSHPGFGEGVGLAALTLGSRLGFLAGPPAVGWVATATTLPQGIALVAGCAVMGALAITWLGLGGDGGGRPRRHNGGNPPPRTSLP